MKYKTATSITGSDCRNTVPGATAALGSDLRPGKDPSRPISMEIGRKNTHFRNINPVKRYEQKLLASTGQIDETRYDNIKTP